MKNVTYIKEFACRLQRGTKVGKGGDRNKNAQVKNKMCITLDGKYGIYPCFFYCKKSWRSVGYAKANQYGTGKRCRKDGS